MLILVCIKYIINQKSADIIQKTVGMNVFIGLLWFTYWLTLYWLSPGVVTINYTILWY
jgi:hypothetical protein